MESGKSDTSIAKSLLANVQLGLPGTVTKLSAKMRFIDHIAPILKNSGVIRSLSSLPSLSIRVSGIATAHNTVPAFGGVLYSAGAVRQDLYVNNGSIYQTYQDSLVDIDEADDIDISKKLKFVHMEQVYELLDMIIREEERPQLVVVDTPLLLERSDEPIESHEQLYRDYKRCMENINQFWALHKEHIYPFNPNGLRIVSLHRSRFGAVFYGLTSNKKHYLIDEIDNHILENVSNSFDRIKKVGVKKLLHGVLTRRSRTAAYEYEILTDDNRLEPKSVRELGLINYHFRSGLQTLPFLAEVIGSKKDWTTEMIDQLTEDIIALFTIDQPKALPLPLWYATYALKPITNGAILQYYKTQAREMIKNEEVENVWKEEKDLFLGDHK
ncbi:hypothetical protein [Priestia megaterium]|uniref:hypothetical protein n=1 Tax=Priestia megaterium TaxID=1404 RepID=UPI0030098A93